ncbi:uncharacterized protein M421DRAFT_76635, partial [Didymella exigua CBS 183.55]
IYINKEGFLPAFKDAFFNMFTAENLGLVPLNTQVVLDRLKVRLRTLLEPLLPETLWQLKTLSNTYKFRS